MDFVAVMGLITGGFFIIQVVIRLPYWVASIKDEVVMIRKTNESILNIQRELLALKKKSEV